MSIKHTALTSQDEGSSSRPGSSASSNQGTSVQPFMQCMEVFLGLEKVKNPFASNRPSSPLQGRVTRKAPSLWQSFQLFFKKLGFFRLNCFQREVEERRFNKLLEVFTIELKVTEEGIPRTSSNTLNEMAEIAEEELGTKILECIDIGVGLCKKFKREFPSILDGESGGIGAIDATEKREQIADEFAKKIIKIRDALLNRAKGVDWVSVEQIQAMLSEITKDPVYQLFQQVDSIGEAGISTFLANLDTELASSQGEAVENCKKYILFLQVLAHLTRTADTSDIYEKWGKQELENQQAEEIFGKTLEKCLKDPQVPTHSRDSRIQTLWWSICHPQKALRARFAHSHALDYNGFQGNASSLGVQYESGGRVAKFLETPGITGDNVYSKMIFPLYQKLGMHQLMFNYQDLSNKVEAQRIEQVNQWASESNGQFTHVVLGHNTPHKWLKQWIKEHPQQQQQQLHAVAKDFLETLQLETLQQQQTQSGATQSETSQLGKLPPEYLTVEKVEYLQGVAQKAEKILPEEGSFEDKAFALLFLLQEVIAVEILSEKVEERGVLTSHSEEIHPEEIHPDLRKGTLYVNGACKENFDRAPAHNALRQLLWIAKGGKLSFANIEPIFGTALGRAPLNADRHPQYKRWKPLIVLLQGSLGKAIRPGRDLTQNLTEGENALRDILSRRQEV